MSLWLLIVFLTLATLAFKTIGPLWAGGIQPPAPLSRVIDLFGPTLIAALVVSNTFTDAGKLAIDERAVGLAVGFLLLLIRTPILVAGLAAAGVCAGIRLLG